MTEITKLGERTYRSISRIPIAEITSVDKDEIDKHTIMCFLDQLPLDVLKTLTHYKELPRVSDKEREVYQLIQLPTHKRR